MNNNTESQSNFWEELVSELEKAKSRIGASPDEYKSSLDFAQKIMGLGFTPRPAFEAQLQAKLLSRISQTGPKTKSGSFWERLLTSLRSPIWRAVTPVVVVLLVIGVLWAAGILPRFNGGVPAPSPAPVPPPTIIIPSPTSPPVPYPTPVPMPIPRPTVPSMPFKASVVPEEARYLPGDPVEVKLSLTNVSSTPITLDLYPPEIRVTPRMNFDQAGTRPLEIKPNETVSVDFTWDQKDKAGRQVQPGWYNIIFGDISVKQGDTIITFNPGAHVLIQYPQGAMTKSFDLNQSQTVNGITVTLERVELTADGSSFYFFFIPPGYTPPPTMPGLPPMPPTISIMAKAEYTVSGITKNAGTAGFNTRGNGMIFVWGGEPVKLDPVPSDAKELTFTITQINNWQGPWEFKVQLN